MSNVKDSIDPRPNPGSDEAIAGGCICPIMDNHHGSDLLGELRGFVVVVGCPMHHPEGEQT